MSKIIADEVITKVGGVPEMLKLVDFIEKEEGKLDFGNFQIIWGRVLIMGILQAFNLTGQMGISQ